MFSYYDELYCVSYFQICWSDLKLIKPELRMEYSSQIDACLYHKPSHFLDLLFSVFFQYQQKWYSHLQVYHAVMLKQDFFFMTYPERIHPLYYVILKIPTKLKVILSTCNRKNTSTFCLRSYSLVNIKSWESFV